MPRPNRNRKMIAVHLPEKSIDRAQTLADTYGTTRAEVLRLSVRYGMGHAERDLAGRLYPDDAEAATG